MESKTVVTFSVGLILGGLLVALLVLPNKVSSPNNGHMTNTSKSSDLMSGEHGMNMSMAEMSEALASLEGEAFDKAFIEMMIDHHQGAINMATLAREKAQHNEIKTLADEIIKAQTGEILEMREWQNNWGYSSVFTASTISWADAKPLFSQCKVMMTAELHSGELQLTLTDESIKRIKPYVKSELESEIQAANNKCPTQIIIAME